MVMPEIMKLCARITGRKHQEKKIPRVDRDTAHTLHTPPLLEAPTHFGGNAPVRGNVVETPWERARDGTEVGSVRNAECDVKGRFRCVRYCHFRI
jgi:hypothetical protein